MSSFATLQLPAEPTVTAPDGSDVRVLLQLDSGSMAHFALAPGKVSRAIVHRSVEEIWYVLEGAGEMWRKSGAQEQVVALRPGTCITIPVGTQFQFRAAPSSSLAAVGITMPPWPGADEAHFVEGPWPASTPKE
jgi:mannose-6-phosphate isomerase-like protein (cupin superfamily)